MKNETNTQHTPAPWHVTLTGHIASQKGNIVAFTGGEVANSMGGKSLLHPDERRANAQLIASAPSLLKENEQLKITVESIRVSLNNSLHREEKATEMVLCLKALNAELLEALKEVEACLDQEFQSKDEIVPPSIVSAYTTISAAISKAEIDSL